MTTGGTPGTGQRLATWARVALAAAVLDTVAMAISLIVIQTHHIHSSITANGAWINIAAGPTFPLLAAVMLRNRDRTRPQRQDRLAWVFLGLGVLCTLTGVVFTYAAWGLPRHAPFAVQTGWVESWLWTSVVPGVELLLLWFPTGEVVSPRWRWAVRGAIAADVGMWLGVAFTPGKLSDFKGTDNPLGWRAGQHVLGLFGGVGFALMASVFLAAVWSLAVRFRRGDARVRAQLRWLLLSLSIIVATIATPVPSAFESLALALNILATFMLPVTLGVALVRRDGLILPRLLVYGLLSTFLLGAYIAVVALSDVALGRHADRAGSLLAAGLVTVLFAPIRSRLQRAVDRLVYGDRGDPYAALAGLGHRIAGSPDDLLQEVVRAVADALRAPYVAVVLAADVTPTAFIGRDCGPQVVLPLTVRSEAVGTLVVAQRSPREQYGERDIALLNALAGHIAVAAHAAALTRDLQRSRESLVITREEERRRIRRDLHDGLGPALAGVAFGLDAARNTLAHDPLAVDAALAELKAEVQTSISDVRRLVYDLRPPALDQLGLVPAVQEYAARIDERGGLTVLIDASALPSLPAAVEVAAYRIATEALTNAARHSHATQTTVRFAFAGGQLRLEVRDDGVGIVSGTESRGGVGLAAMAERAAELGGTCSVGGNGSGGTSVVALLPVRAAS